VPVPERLRAALLEWKGVQEGFKGRRILCPSGIVFAASQFVFAGYSGEPSSNRAFNLRRLRINPLSRPPCASKKRD
jgi:hypothetical protein